jgi:exonuclease I
MILKNNFVRDSLSTIKEIKLNPDNSHVKTGMILKLIFRYRSDNFKNTLSKHNL